MRISHRELAFFVIGIAISAMVGACSILTDFTGLSGGAGDRTEGGGAGDAGLDAPDGGSDAASPACPPYELPAACEASLLTDDHNCCIPGRDCQGGSCVNGACRATVIVSDATTDARGIAVGGPDLLVWATGCANQLRTVSKSGARMAPLPPGQHCTPTLAVQGANAYWIEWDGPRLNAAPLDGSQPARIVAEVPRANTRAYFARLAVDANNAYWAMSSPAAIWWAPLGATAATPKALAADTSTNLAVEPAQSPYGVAVDAAYVYWADTGGAAVKRRSLATLASNIAAQTIVPGESGARDIALDAQQIYWLTSDGFVRARAKDGTGSSVTLASGQTAPESIVVDDRYVYWTNYVSGGSVNRVPKGGGNVQQLATGQSFPYGLTQDCGTVYWTNQAHFATGQIVKVTK